VPFRIAFVPGVTPGKWSRIWAERETGNPLELIPVDEHDQVSVLHDARADMSFVRLPVDDAGLHLIPLYREVPVVVVPVDHPVALFDEIAVDELADEHLLQNPDAVPEWRDISSAVRDGTRVDVPPMSVKQAIETIAAGTGIVIVPMSVARLHNRKDVAYRPVTGVAESQIGLAWSSATEDPRIETFIGIVRGRTARSSRSMETVQKNPAGATKPVPAKGKPRSTGKRPVRRAGGRRRG
jgi:DNA-binding transcriptional LysR family regulator